MSGTQAITIRGMAPLVARLVLGLVLGFSTSGALAQSVTSTITSLTNGNSGVGLGRDAGATIGAVMYLPWCGPEGCELWRTDGTAAGTRLVKDIEPGAGSSSPSGLTVIGGTLFFAAYDSANGRELWRSDGTAEGTVLVRDIASGATSSSPSGLVALGNALVFSAYGSSSAGVELWTSNGTSASTIRVADIYAGSTSSAPEELTVVGGFVHFSAEHPLYGRELWRTDGTLAGTSLVSDLVPGVGWSDPRHLTRFGSALVFVAHTPSIGNELFRSDSAGTQPLKDIVAGTGSSDPSELVVAGSSLFFSAKDTTAGQELWRSDGTESGTFRVKDIRSGSASSSPREIRAAGAILFFSADDGTTGNELWRTDGTEAGTVLVKDLWTGAGPSSPAGIEPRPNGVIFSARGTEGSGLYISDGTPEGTALVAETLASTFGEIDEIAPLGTGVLVSSFSTTAPFNRLDLLTVTSLPTLSAPTSSNPARSSANLGGTVNTAGGSAISGRGVVYSETATNSNPLLGGAGVRQVSTTGTLGSFVVVATGLSSSTAYSFRAYATNSEGTGYTSVATFTTSAASVVQAAMTSPAPGSTLASATPTFQWDTGSGIIRYWLSIGAAEGGTEFYDAPLGTSQSVSVPLPADGRTLFVRLWSYTGTAWLYNDYTYTGLTAVAAAMVSPAPRSALVGATTDFQWNSGTGINRYWLSIGNTPGGVDIYDALQGTSQSAAVVLPSDGRTIFVRLWSHNGAAWLFNDYTYQAVNAPAAMLSPAPSSTLTATSVTFQWNAGIGITRYWLYVGNALGGRDLFDKNLETSLSTEVSSLPADGRTLFVRLFSHNGTAWVFNDYTYRALTAQSATMASPAPGSTLGAAIQTFQWNSENGISRYWLYVGSTQGGSDIYNADQGTSLSVPVSLPGDGRALFVRLWSYNGATWLFSDYAYTALTVVPAAMSSPAPGSTLSGRSATFQWDRGAGIDRYWLYVGNTLGGRDIHDADQGVSLSASLSGLPADGRTLFVRLWSLAATGWVFSDYTYEAYDPAAAMLSPAPGSTLTGSSATFQWNSGTGISQYWLYIGNTLGGSDLYDAAQGTNLSVPIASLPIDGRTLFVRLWSREGTTWLFKDYTYQASSPAAAMVSPAPGFTLTSASATFQWSSGIGMVSYWLYVGSTPGGLDLYNVSQATSLSVTVSGLPTDGRTLYVRLWSYTGTTWVFNDYTYTASPSP